MLPPFADVSKSVDVARLFKDVDATFGRLDVLVQALQHQRPRVDSDVQAAVKQFGSEGGSIINLSSIVGSHPVAGAVLYASTKGAIETLTKALALELAPRKIRVNAIAPGHGNRKRYLRRDV